MSMPQLMQTLADMTLPNLPPGGGLTSKLVPRTLVLLHHFLLDSNINQYSMWDLMSPFALKYGILYGCCCF